MGQYPKQSNSAKNKVKVKVSMRIALQLCLASLVLGAPQSYSRDQTGALDAATVETIQDIFRTNGRQVDVGSSLDTIKKSLVQLANRLRMVVRSLETILENFGTNGKQVDDGSSLDTIKESLVQLANRLMMVDGASYNGNTYEEDLSAPIIEEAPKQTQPY